MSSTPSSAPAARCSSAADAGHVRARDRPVRAAGVAVSGNAVSHLMTGLDPGGHRARGTEVDIVGVGGDDQDALDTGVVVEAEGWRPSVM